MSHPFGDLIKQYLSRKHGLSQNKLALDIHCDRSLVSRMCKGERLYTPSARIHIINMIGWFLDHEILRDLEEANSLLNAANVIDLRKENPDELEIINRIFNLTIKSDLKNINLQASPQATVKRPLNNLPYPFYGKFIGREVEFNMLIQYLRPGSELERYIYPISIDGIGGIGKSSLALAIGHYFNNNPEKYHFHGIIWVSAKERWFLPTGLVPKSVRVYRTLKEILRAIGKVLGFYELLEEQTEDNWVEIVYQQLQKKPTLLIIDNLETIDDDSVISFLQELPPPTKAILTTRRKIDITRSIPLGAMNQNDAIKLIDNLGMGHNLNQLHKEKILTLTGSVPLILVWSMGQINSGMPVDVLLQKLTSSHMDDIAKYCFDQSIETIKQHTLAFELLCALSIFETGATRITIGRIGGLFFDEIVRDDGLILLEKLAMLMRNDNLFTMLPLTRSYVLSLLNKDLTLKNKLLNNLIGWSQEIIKMNLEKDQSIIEYLDNEHGVLLMAIEHCIDTGLFHDAEEIISFANKRLSNAHDSEWAKLHENLEKKKGHSTKLTKVDWSGAAISNHFYGRTDEIKKLRTWAVLDGCKLISLVGFGGMGKSSLAFKAAEDMIGDFDFIIWRSLANGTKPDELFLQIIQVLVDPTIERIPKDTNGKLNLLIRYLSRFRCLLIIDNFETVLTKGNTDKFLPGYKGFEDLIHKIGKNHIRSCLVLTSREKPLTLLNLEFKDEKVRSLMVRGLSRPDIHMIFNDQKIQLSDELLNTILHRYNGNPLAIRWAINLLRDESTGDVMEIISSKLLPRNINNLIAEQIDRLSDDEMEVLTWAAIEHAPVDLNTLHDDILSEDIRNNIKEIIGHLSRRSLVDLANDQIRLQPFLSDYILDYLMAEITDELLMEKIHIFYNFTLMKAQARDHIRAAQKLLIIEPIVQELRNALGSEQAVVEKINTVLQIARKRPKDLQGYSIGNIINLLAHANHKLNQYDFSHTHVNQALLHLTNLHNVSFYQSDFKDTVFAEIFDIVISVAFSPQADLIASGTVDGKILLWDRIASKQINVLSGHNGWVRSVAFHPLNHKILASGAGDNTVRIWDIENGENRILNAHSDWVRSVTFSPDGLKLASAGSDMRIIIWDIASGNIVNSLEGHSDWIWSIFFSKDGDQIISGSNDSTIRIWDIKQNTAKILRHLDARVMSLAYSPSNELVASGGSDHLIKIWDIKSGELIQTLRGHSDSVWCLKFSPDGKLLFSGGMDKNIIVWDLQTGIINKILNGHDGYVTSIDRDPLGNILVSAGYDQSIRLWDIKSGQCIRRLEGKSNSVNSVSIQPTRTLIASGGDDHLIHIWDHETREHKIALDGHRNRIKSLSFSHNGLLLASGSDDQTVKVWDIQKETIKLDLTGHSAWVYSVAFNPDDTQLASGSDDFSIRLWDCETGNLLNTLKQDNFIYAVAFSSNGNVLASGGADKKIWLWDVSTGKLRRKLEGHSLRVNSLVFGENDLLVSGSDDRVVKLWDIEAGQCIGEYNGHEGQIRAVSLHLNSEIIVSCGDDKTARIWSLSGESIHVIQNEYNYRSCTINQGGNLLILSDTAGLITLWNLNSMKSIATLRTNRIYENMNIAKTSGLTNAQKTNIKELGAIE
jgi:WD40 repeat protein/plasmid maintenance system antidote protein VapI